MGGSWFYSRVGNTGCVQDFVFLFLILIKGMKRQSDVNQGNEGEGLKIFLRACKDGKTLLIDLLQVVKNIVWCGVCGIHN